MPEIEMFKWNSLLDQIRAESTAKTPKRDRMRLALKYRALLDSGRFASRAALARHLGVSRARITQVLRRLEDVNREQKDAFAKCVDGERVGTLLKQESDVGGGTV